MTQDEKAEDYDRLKYEFTQINQELKSEKHANKELTKQLFLYGVVKRTLDRKIVASSENENWFANENYKGIDKNIVKEKEKEATELNAQIRVLRFIDSTIKTT